MTRHHSVARAAHQNMNLWGKKLQAHRVWIQNQTSTQSPRLFEISPTTSCSRSGRYVWYSCWSVIIQFYQQTANILTISLHHLATFCILERRTSPLWIVWDLTVKFFSSPQLQGWIGVWKGLHVPNIKLSRYWTYSREAFCVWYWTSKVITHRCRTSFLNIPSKLRKAQKYPVKIVKIMKLRN